MSSQKGGDDEQQVAGNSLYAAVARTATRSIALYFSRPVRLFRPSKVSGWQVLKGLAMQHGQTLSPQYISWLIKEQGFMVLPKHLIPPMLVNLALGSVLWTTYGEASDFLAPQISSPLCVAALSGGIAGGTQAVLAAPAENVRLLLEGGLHPDWSHAWKEVFRGTQRDNTISVQSELHEARQVRQWMKEVGEMAGRGWDGWGWGCGKDICGFAVFFSIFELTRSLAAKMKAFSESTLFPDGRCESDGSVRNNTPRIIHAATLVSGGAAAGLAYELACRPWDIARKAVHIDRVTAGREHHSIVMILTRKLSDGGFTSFFENPFPAIHADDGHVSPFHRRLHSAMRTLARVGPWGVGFLVWEAFGPGIS